MQEAGAGCKWKNLTGMSNRPGGLSLQVPAEVVTRLRRPWTSSELLWVKIQDSFKSLFGDPCGGPKEQLFSGHS
jgi:hypothetical protein